MGLSGGGRARPVSALINFRGVELMVVLGLAYGMLTVEQTIAAGELIGEKHCFAAVFGP